MRARGLAKGLAAGLLLALAAGPAAAQGTELVPDRRVLLAEGVDYPGGDLAQILDASESGCEAACLADPSCTAFTYNRRAQACFPKSAASDPVPFAGALSGRVLAAPAGLADRAAARAAALPALGPEDLAAALDQARDIGRRQAPGAFGAADLVAAARAEEAAGNLANAARFLGGAVALTDAADLWADYGRLQLALPSLADDQRRDNDARALAAAVNGYLRAGDDRVAAGALLTLAEALEVAGRGRDMIAALRLAQDLAPRADIADRLAEARARYGFRIAEHQVESDAALPRICAVFTEALAGGIDLAPFVQLPEPGLAVEAEGERLCVSGVVHGSRYRLVFRDGIPAASGEVMAGDVEIAAYVRDRAPAVRFPGRAYVLPQTPDAGIPVETVNATAIELALRRVSDRNLVRALREGWFARPLDSWEAETFATDLAEEVWRGSAEVAMEVNRDMTARLPVADLAGVLPAGIYALEAQVPGQDTWDTPAATQWFVVSDLGLTALQGTDGLHLFVRGLSDAAPRAGLTVQLVSRANAVLAETATDAEGRASFAAALVAGRGGAAPALVTVTAESGGVPADFAFLPLTDPEFDLSDRGVEGRAPAPPIDLFLATERGAYRAGETVHATLVARDPDARAIAGLPLTARLVRPDGVEHARQPVTADAAGGALVRFDLTASVPRGPWRIEVLADPAAAPLASARVLVEDFLPERIEADLGLPDGPLALGSAVRLDVTARYLFGAPGAGLSVEGDFRLFPAETVPGWEGFRFGRHDEGGPMWGDALGGGTTDAGGGAALTLALPALPEAAQPMTARVAVRVAEGSGRPIERRAERLVLPQAVLPAIRPLFEGGTVPDGAEARFRLAAIGPDGAAAPLAARWVLNRVERRYQWYALYGQWTWEVTTRRSRVATAEIDLAPGAPQEIALPVERGEYELVLETRGGATTASVDFYAGWYVAEGAAAETPDALTVALDRAAYRPGDTALARIEAAADGVALVTVLGSRLIDMKAVPVRAGMNEIALPVTEDWGAGAYVAASVLRPLSVAAGRAPVRALGLAHAAVDPGDRALATRFEVAAEADPRGPLPVRLRVEGLRPGEPAFATIAAVDVGILNLTGHAPPDPQGHYFGQRRLGVAIRDLYGRLIDGQAGAAGRIRQGGDAGSAARLEAPPPTEDLVAYVAGPLPVGPDGWVETSFDLPAFNGTVRLTAIAWSVSGLGQASADVLVRDPVVVTASAPRFLAPGDESRLLLELAHASGPGGRLGLDVTATGVALGPVPSGLDLAEGARAVLEIPMVAPDATGPALVRIALTTPGGRVLTREVPFDIRATDPPVMRQSRFALGAGQDFAVTADVFAGLRPGTAQATVAIGPVARFDAAGLLAALDRYPYGCTEQITSRALPLLYLSSVAGAMGLGTTEDLEDRVAQAIDAVLLNQSPSGSFGLWRPDGGDFWLDAYVTDFLGRARAQGFAVPETAFAMALDNLRNRVNYAPDFDSGGADLAYALMVLAREGAAAVGDLRYYADVKAGAFDTPLALAQLGAALAAYGDPTRAEAMFTRARAMAEGAMAVPEAPLWRADYGSALRDAAGVLALAAEAGSAASGAPVLEAAVARGVAAGGLSTQEQVWALMATQALIDRPGAEGFTLDGVPVTGPLVRLLDAATFAAPVTLGNGTAREEVLTLTTFGVPVVPEPAGGNGYAIARRYFTPDGAPVDPAAVAQGTRLVAVIEVTPFEEPEARLIVDDPLPAGFEIENPALLSGGETGGFAWLGATADTRMAEFRADRFRAAVDWGGTRPFRLAYVVRAVSPGVFAHPAAGVEDMYRPDRRAWTGAGRVVVTP